MEVKQIRRRMLTAALLLIIAAALLIGGIATYAWFTSNQKVSTSRATARTGEETIELLISSTGRFYEDSSSEADIYEYLHSNGDSNTYSAADRLMPVSTADLVYFVSPVAYNDNGDPVRFNYFGSIPDGVFHGCVYLLARASGAAAGSRMALYLDETAASGGILAQKSEQDSLLLNAARLGLALEDGERVIFRLSEDTNPEGARRMNTFLNGEAQPEGIVLQWGDDGGVYPVPDPAVPVSSRSLHEDGTLGAPIGYLELERVYKLDIYFYLEGCDPDCWDSIFFDGSDLHLAFYGVLS